MFWNDVLLVFYIWVVMGLWQVAVGGVMMKKLNKVFVDGGWVFARLIYVLGMALPIWWIGHVGLGLNYNWLVKIAGAVALFLLARYWWSNKEVILTLMKKRWRLLLVEEVLFAIGLFGLAIVRGFNPDILDLEKFMDAGFIQMYMKTPRLPAEDMWLAGFPVNYYTFGHFWASVWMRLVGLELTFGYNILLGVIMGMVLAGSFSVVVNMIGQAKKTRFGTLLVGGVVGSLLVTIGGNSQVLWYGLMNQGFVGYWYADATRFIENTIHEFPSYSFVVSDLHAHVLGLPMVLLFMLMITAWVRRSKTKEVLTEVGIGLLMGVMVMTSTWDVLVYGLVMVMVGLWLYGSGQVKLLSLLKSAGVVLGMMMLIAAPWWIHFENIGQGVRLVEKRSGMWELAALWIGHMVILLVALVASMRSKDKKTKVMVWGIAMSAILLLLIPEIVYVKDIYPNHPRANTMFKLTYQAFVMMGILGGYVIGKSIDKGSQVLEKLMKVVVLVIAAGLMVWPWFGYRGYYGNFKTYKGMHGLVWMRREAPEEYEAIKWLRENTKGRPVVLEAVGESYTKNGRVSVFSGLPTVLGWRVHEWLWRGSFDIPGKRTEEVKLIYEKPGSEEAKELLEKYQVEYIFVGSLEKETYKIDQKRLLGLGEVVLEGGEVKILKL